MIEYVTFELLIFLSGMFIGMTYVFAILILKQKFTESDSIKQYKEIEDGYVSNLDNRDHNSNASDL